MEKKKKRNFFQWNRPLIKKKYPFQVLARGDSFCVKARPCHLNNDMWTFELHIDFGGFGAYFAPEIKPSKQFTTRKEAMFRAREMAYNKLHTFKDRGRNPHLIQSVCGILEDYLLKHGIHFPRD